MPVSQRNNTAYAQYVFSNVRAILDSGGGMYNYNELAGKVGLKPTQHFRRRINQMWNDGLISCDAVFTPRGGIENRFSKRTVESQEIPF